MGVYIKDMDMPKGCGKCKMHFLSSNDYVCCSITDRIPKSIAKFKNSKTDLDFRKASIEAVNRPDWCPLVEVKAPHGRLIDADALCESGFADVYEDVVCDGYVEDSTWGFSRDTILREPVIIEAEK